MKIALRNIEMMLKWNIENNGSFVEKAMLIETRDILMNEILKAAQAVEEKVCAQ